MSKIHQLNIHLTNMIAAGEVVERPMGIVKELVENAIDAQATRIEVNVLEGGIQSIEIIDNGCGMDSEDASLAFERHATSKISSTEDLWNINTLGFRGEALPSIASVSQLLLMSSNGEESTRIEIAYGKTISAKPFDVAQGTHIIVEGLFQKTPARLKHLKTVSYENSLIVDVIEKFALSHPEIAFSFSSDGRENFKTSGKGDLLEVIHIIYGKDMAKAAVRVEGKDYDFTVEGIAILPHFHRATRNYMTVFINGRMIRSYRIQKAIGEAYKYYLASDRYPIVILNIKMDAKLVDVNVHPSKWEIRMSKEQQLDILIADTLKKCLQGSMETIEVKTVSPITEKIQFPSFQLDTASISSYVEANKEIMTEMEEPVNVTENQIAEEPTAYMEAKKPSFPQMDVIGQLHGKYILASAVEGLYIIDQHAAEERVHYEQYQKLMLDQNCMMQDLLVPTVLQGNAFVVSRLAEVNEILKAIHVEFESFGQNTLVCRRLPIWMKDIEEEAFLQDVLDLWRSDKDVSEETLKKATIASLACHHSIRFNHVLRLDEMKQVIADLALCEQPYNCPHGRPTLICISEQQLQKEFYR